MDPRLRARSRIISMAVLLLGVLISGTLFFLNWVYGDRYTWNNWLMSLSYAVFLGSGLIAFIIQLGLRYDLPPLRVAGFFMIIGWIAGSLISTTLDTLTVLSSHLAQGISYVIVVGGLFVLVIPGFLLMLFPWPPTFLNPRDNHNKPGTA
jgi:magnesium-transporting ATPase (P-type)